MKKLALLVCVFLIPCAVQASSLININTADATLLDTLPGIGPTYAGRIVDYRTAHGPFAVIGDIENVNGIGPATFAKIEALISVSGDNPPDPTTSSSSITPAGTIASNPLPPNEPAVFVDAGGNRTVIAGADTAYTASVTDKNGVAYPNPEVHWCWGDGSTAIGASVYKSYPFPGTYLVGVSVLAGGGSGNDGFTVTVKDAQVAITKVSADGITVANKDATDTLDLSLWKLSSGSANFSIPAGTKIVAGGSVTFSPTITGLTSSANVTLRYPSGSVAAGYEPTSVQPPAPAARSISVQSIKVTAPVYATKPVSAPATSTQVAAAGAALSSVPERDESSTTPARVSLRAALESPWTLGFLGLLAFSGAAFIVL